MTNKSNDDIETIGKLNEKVGKLGKTITDQDTVIKVKILKKFSKKNIFFLIKKIPRKF